MTEARFDSTGDALENSPGSLFDYKSVRIAVSLFFQELHATDVQQAFPDTEMATASIHN